MTASAEITPLQRARMLAAAQAVRDGSHREPLVCAECRSASIHDDGETILDLRGVEIASYLCVACGKRTSVRFAHVDRKQRIRAFIAKGIDIPLTRLDKAKAS